MMKKGFLMMFICLIVCCMQLMAQNRVVITNLNTKEENELKLNEEFYFGINSSKEVFKGKIDSYDFANKSLRINNKIYAISEIVWIDFKGHKPKKYSSKISKILLYFGAGLITFGAYEQLVANDDKTALVTASAGAICTVGALAFWVIPRQPRFDFTTKHLLELVPMDTSK
jgi:hypothetical protein